MIRAALVCVALLQSAACLKVERPATKGTAADPHIPRGARRALRLDTKRARERLEAHRELRQAEYAEAHANSKEQKPRYMRKARKAAARRAEALVEAQKAVRKEHLRAENPWAHEHARLRGASRRRATGDAGCTIDGTTSCSNCDAESDCTGDCYWVSINGGECRDDPCASDTCHPNNHLHCLFADPNDSYCQETRVPCRDCVDPGESCYGNLVCEDHLATCGYYYSEEQIRDLPAGHPCGNEFCKSSRTGDGCSEAVYEFCCNPEYDDECDPSEEVLEAREDSECTPEGCISFMRSTSSSTASLDGPVCPFDSPELCSEPACTDYAYDIYYELSSGECWGDSCMLDIAMDYAKSERPSTPDTNSTATPDTNSTDPRRRAQALSDSEAAMCQMCSEELRDNGGCGLYDGSISEDEIGNYLSSPECLSPDLPCPTWPSAVICGFEPTPCDQDDPFKDRPALCTTCVQDMVNGGQCGFLNGAEFDPSVFTDDGCMDLMDSCEELAYLECDMPIDDRYDECDGGDGDDDEDGPGGPGGSDPDDDDRNGEDEPVDGPSDDDREPVDGPGDDDDEWFGELDCEEDDMIAFLDLALNGFDSSDGDSPLGPVLECIERKNLTSADLHCFGVPCMNEYSQLNGHGCDGGCVNFDERDPRYNRAKSNEACSYAAAGASQDPRTGEIKFAAENRTAFNPSWNANVTEEQYNTLGDVFAFRHSCYADEGYDDDYYEEDGEPKDWNYTAACVPEAEGVVEGCGTGCCATYDDITAGRTISWGGPLADTQSCLYAETRSSAGQTCLEEVCSGCFDGDGDGIADGKDGAGGGPLGPPEDQGFFEHKRGRERCAESYGDFCKDHPLDSGCRRNCAFSCSGEEGCPCDVEACVEALEAPFNVSSSCTDYRQALLKAYSEQGFVAPDNRWELDYYQQLGLFRSPAAEGAAFVESDELRNMSLACEAADAFRECLPVVVDHCNGDKNWWSPGCRNFGSCGDGVVSWGERCDDGNTYNWDDGCQHCHVTNEAEFYCSSPGQSCQRCVRNGRGEDGACPFCLNELVQNATNPCRVEACQRLDSYADAAACDAATEDYCDLIEAEGLQDPGCHSYEPAAPYYTVPSVVGGNCSYSIRSVDVPSENLRSIKLLLVECALSDPNGVILDGTPYVRYSSPKHSLTDSAYQRLNGDVQTGLDELTQFPRDTMVSSTILTEFEVNVYSDPLFYTDSGTVQPEQSNPYSTQVAKLQLSPNEDDDGDDDYRSDDYSECNHVPGDRELQMLPPCVDPFAEAARFELRKKQFRARVYQDDWEWPDIKYMDIDGMDFPCTPKKDVVQFYTALSSTYTEWRGSTTVEMERHERHCTYDGGEGESPGDEDSCPSIEDLVRDGTARINFGNQLYPKECNDKRCDLRIMACDQVGLRPARGSVNVTDLVGTIDRITGAANKLEGASNSTHINKVLTEVGVLAQGGSMSAVRKLFEDLAVKNTTTRVLKAVEDYCPHEHGSWNESTLSYEVNPDWESDPCCNWELREYMCCPPQDVADGRVTVVSGFDLGNLNSMCRDVDAAMATMRDLYAGLEVADEYAAMVETYTSGSEWDEIWEFEEDCRQRIEGDGETCESDADCYCAQSTCGAYSNQCETPEGEMYKCYAYCFHEEYGAANPTMYGFFKQELGLTAESTYDDFVAKWGEEMTESGCAIRQWNEDIGYAGMYHTSDFECRRNHTCSLDSWVHLNQEEYAEEHDYTEYLDLYSTDNATCASDFNGTVQCLWFDSSSQTCSGPTACVPQLPEGLRMPCEEANECNSNCHEMEGKTYCESPDGFNGTWIPQDADSTGEYEGSCCPYGKHILNSTHSGLVCAHHPRALDNVYVDDETCCKSFAGEWYTALSYDGSESYAQCCFGEVSTYWDEQIAMYRQSCNQYWSAHESTNACYRGCEDLWQECTTCHSEVNSCYKEEYRSQSKEACLREERCNNEQKRVDAWYDPDDPDAWDAAMATEAAQCTGGSFCANPWGWPESEEALCILKQSWENWDYSTNGALNSVECAAMSGTMVQRHGEDQCTLPVLRNLTTAESCFPAICAPTYNWTATYPGTPEPENGGIWHNQACDAGCYVDPAAYSHADAEINGAHFWYDATTKRLSSTGISQSDCESISGASYLQYRYEFVPAMRLTEDTCAAGRCEGTISQSLDPVSEAWLGDQPWTKEECRSLSEASCTEGCPACLASSAWEWGAPEATTSGACFNETTQEVLHGVLRNASCTAVGTKWYECAQPELKRYEWSALEGLCAESAEELPSYARSKLQCRASHRKCLSEAECESLGECDDAWQWRTFVCNNGNWSHGDTHHWHGFRTELDEEGEERTVSVTEECAWEDQSVVEGACVKARDGGAKCEEEWMEHPSGCRVFGAYNASACLASNGTWGAPKTKEECLSRTVCRIGWWDTEFGAEECERCGGEQVGAGVWHAAYWGEAYVREMVHHNATRMEAVNEWLPSVQASYKLAAFLGRPTMRTFANYKVTEILAKYNLFRENLVELACNCGDGCSAEEESAFLGDGEAADVGKTASFATCGEEETIVGPGQEIRLNASCSEGGRRLSEQAGGNEVSFTFRSAGGHARHEPCADAALFDALVVENDGGAVVGQLIGDGLGINATEDFESVSFCLDARLDLYLREDTFDTVAVGRRGEDGVVRVDSSVVISSNSTSRVCLSASAAGEYFPVLTIAEEHRAGACSATCPASKGTCVIGSDGSSQCLCRCGFSGDGCALGCPNYCNDNGDCNAQSNVCTCDMGTTRPLFVEDDCSKMNCPVGPSGQTCSGRGTCGTKTGDAVCTCDSGFEGDACESAIFLAREVDGISGFDEPDDVEDPNADPDGLLPDCHPNCDADPTSAPTPSPTAAPVDVSGPTAAPTMPEVESIAEITVPLDADSVTDDTAIALIDDLRDGVLATLDVEDGGAVDAIVTLEVEETSSLTLASPPSDAEKALLLDAIADARCGGLAEDECRVVEGTPSRRLAALSNSADEPVAAEDAADSLSESIPKSKGGAAAPESNSKSKPQEESAEQVVERFGRRLQQSTFSFTVLLSITEDSDLSGSTALSDTSFRTQLSSAVPAVTVSAVAAPQRSVTSVVDVVVDVDADVDVDSLQDAAEDGDSLVENIADATGDDDIVDGEVEVDLCGGRDCNGHGQCAEGLCTCTSGWMGLNCLEPPATAAPTAAPESGGGGGGGWVCFPSHAQVETADGSKKISELKIGERIRTLDHETGEADFSEVVALPHASLRRRAEAVVRLVTAGGQSLEATRGHLVAVVPKDRCADETPLAEAGAVLVAAEAVRVGDCAVLGSGRVAPVAAVEEEESDVEVLSVVTMDGRLVVVDGVAASSFGGYHSTAHMYYNVHRALFRAGLKSWLQDPMVDRVGDALGGAAHGLAKAVGLEA